MDIDVDMYMHDMFLYRIMFMYMCMYILYVCISYVYVKGYVSVNDYVYVSFWLFNTWHHVFSLSLSCSRALFPCIHLSQWEKSLQCPRQSQGAARGRETIAIARIHMRWPSSCMWSHQRQLLNLSSSTGLLYMDDLEVPPF